jgi:hypothetical protein
VALTRARDRLYLAGTVANAKLTLQRGSIGRVLPATLTAAMAAGGADLLIWAGASASHSLRRVPPAAEAPRAWRAAPDGRSRLNDHMPFGMDQGSD